MNHRACSGIRKNSEGSRAASEFLRIPLPTSSTMRPIVKEAQPFSWLDDQYMAQRHPADYLGADANLQPGAPAMQLPRLHAARKERQFGVLRVVGAVAAKQPGLVRYNHERGLSIDLGLLK